MDIHRPLVGGCRGENPGIPGRKGTVALNETGGHTSHRLNGQTQRRHIQKEQVLVRTCRHKAVAFQRTSKNSRSLGHTFVRIDISGGLLTCQRPHFLLDSRDPGRASHKKHSSKLRRGDARVAEGTVHRLGGALNEIPYEILELPSCKGQIHMQYLSPVLSQIRQHDMGALRCGQLLLGLLSRLPHPLHGSEVPGEIRSIFLFKTAYQPLGDPLVKIIPAQVIVPCGGQNFNDSLPNLDDGNIKGASAQIVHHNLLGFPVVQPVRQGCACRLVDDTLYVKARNPPCILGGLPLDVVKVGRHCDDRLCHRRPQEILRVFLKLHQYHGADGLRLIVCPVNAGAPLCAHMPFHGTDGPLRIGGRLAS